MKHNRRATSFLAVVAIAALVGAGCTTDKKGNSGTTAPSGNKLAGGNVGLSYDTGGRGDKAFNDAAALGLDGAMKKLGFKAKELSISKEADRDTNLQILTLGKYNPIVGIGSGYHDSIQKAAAAFPKVTFGTIDTIVALPNVRSNVFAENEGSFLVGVAAALKTQSGKVGFIGGVQTDVVKKYEAGFRAGVAAAKKSVTVDVKYLTQNGDVTGFNAPDKARENAAAMYGSGIDVIFGAAGASNKGLFDAAVAAGNGRWAIGADSDQYLSATPDQQNHILTSMIKRVDVAVRQTVEAAANSTLKGGATVTYDLKRNGVGYSTSGGFLDDVKQTIDGFKQKIASGSIKVPVKP